MIQSQENKQLLLKLFNPFLVDLFIQNDMILAGGAMRRFVNPKDEISDYDFFFKNPDFISRVRTSLENEGYQCTFACPLGSMYSYKKSSGMFFTTTTKVQLITEKTWRNPVELINTFDFTACSAAIDSSLMFYRHNSFFADVKDKEIKLNTISYPVATFKRIFKYKDKGYSISSEVIKEFMELSEQVQSDDKWRFYID